MHNSRSVRSAYSALHYRLPAVPTSGDYINVNFGRQLAGSSQRHETVSSQRKVFREGNLRPEPTLLVGLRRAKAARIATRLQVQLNNLIGSKSTTRYRHQRAWRGLL